MRCRKCGAQLYEAPGATWCPRCSFERALGLQSSERDPPDAQDASWQNSYDLIRDLGRGSMGKVRLARERVLDRLVALKTLAEGAPPEWGARLLREGKSAASLSHPNIVAVYALGGDGPSAYLAMEFIDGGSLDLRIRKSTLIPVQAAALARRIAGAVASAHALGILHRDIKPSNILLDAAGEPHLVDFGLAAPLGGAGDLTLPGHVLGTPAYMAPELLQGSDKASEASDVFGIGGVLFACLTGRAPNAGDSPQAILARLATEDALSPRLLQPSIPRDLNTICLKCLERDPRKRYGSAAALDEDLGAFLDGRPIMARPIGAGGRMAKLCRRHPAAATAILTASLCVLALAVGGPLAAMRLARADAVDKERLREVLLARSQSTRQAAILGTRDEALRAAFEAAAIRGGVDARDEAIAALARPEVIKSVDWQVDAVLSRALGFDVDRDRFAVESKEGELELRRLSDNTFVQHWTGGAGKLWTHPVFSSDGEVAARDGTGRVLVWKIGSQEPLFALPGRRYALTGRFVGYGAPDVFSPDGRVLASVLPGFGVTFHDSRDGREVARIATEVEPTQLEYSFEGGLIAVGRGIRDPNGRESYFARIYDTATLAQVSQPRIESGFQSLHWAPDREFIAIAGQRLDIYNARSGARVTSVNDPQAIAGFFGPGDGTFLSFNQGGELTLWDAGSPRPLLSGPVGSGMESAVSRDGTVIAKSNRQNEVRLLRIDMSAVVRTWPANLTGVRSNVLSLTVPTVDYSPDGHWMATAKWGSITLRDPTGRPVSELPLGTLANYISLRFAPDGSRLLAGTAELGLVGIPVETGVGGIASLGRPTVIDPGTAISLADVSSDGKLAITTSADRNFVRLVPLDGATKPYGWTLSGAAAAAFVDGNRSVITNSLDSVGCAKIEVRSASSGSTIERTLPFAAGAHVNVTKDGRLMVLGSGNSATLLLRGPDWAQSIPLPESVQGMEYPCAFSLDGSTLAIAVGKRVWLLRTSDGQVLAHLQGAQGGSYVPGLAFSPDGRRLAVHWENGQLSVWDIAALRQRLAEQGLNWD